MKFIMRPLIHWALFISIMFPLLACERETYTTWSCSSGGETKIEMVLKKAEMQFQDLKYDYCGSLGNQSFFSTKCPANIQDSDYVFTPSSGLLHGKDREYQCTAL